VSDDEFLQRFEAGSLPPGGFHHADHVKVVWLYLQRFPVPEVLVRLSVGLRALAAAAGKPWLYHETITWAYVFLIRERMARAGHDEGWAEFTRAHADLLDWKDSLLRTYYREETLRSDLARRVFVFPDKRTPVAR
jgi:hypothetical protein